MSELAKLTIIDAEGLHHVPDPALVELGERILRVFLELRTQYVNKRPVVAKKDLMHFYKAAELCRAEGLSAESYVRRQLEGMASIGKFWSSGISSPKFAERTETHNQLWVRSVRHYKSQLTTFETFAKLYGPRQVLEDANVQLTPLFRVVISDHYGFKDLVMKHLDDARLELNGVPPAREVFRGRLGVFGE